MDLNSKQEATEILYQGFKSKWDYMWILTSDEARAKRVIEKSTDFDQSITVRDENNHIIGIAGYDLSAEKLFTIISRETLIEELGLFKGLFVWLRNKCFEYFKVNFTHDMFHIDTIAVSSKSRGQGLGTKLLEQLEHKARELNRRRIVLEVIDSNPRAKELYAKIGYKVTGFETLPFPHNVHTSKAGFKGYYIMEKKL